MPSLTALVAANAQKSLASATGAVYVNTFYKAGEGPTGSSQLLSASYGSLVDAQVDYPSATALTDTKDWCAWKACVDSIYTSGNVGNATSNNLACGYIAADGHYVVNNSIVFNHKAVWVRGAAPTQYGGSGCTVTYNGADGTIDAAVPIFDMWTVDEHDVAPSGRKGDVTGNGIKAIVENILFFGKSGDMTANSQSVSGYVTGIRIRRATYSQITNCGFMGTLYDGIYFTGPQLFAIVSRCYFYTCHRDGISVSRSPSTSTTVWIYNNEFGWVGRYALLLNFDGAIDAFPIVRDNSFEHVQGSIPTAYGFYAAHPEWWVQGVIAGSCVISGENLIWNGNRTENLNFYNGYYGALHVVASTTVEIAHNSATDLVFSSFRNTATRTANAATFFASYKYLDITDDRNYQAPTNADSISPCETVSVSHTNGIIHVVEGVGLGTSGYHTLRDFNTSLRNITSKDGTYGKVVNTLGSVSMPLLSIYNWPVQGNNVAITDTNGANRYGSIDWMQTGSRRVLSGKNAFGQWAASTAVTTGPYTATHSNVNPKEFRVPLTENGLFYECTTGGTTNDTEPTWGTVIGGTTSDTNGSGAGNVVWTCVGRCALHAENLIGEILQLGQRARVDNAAPTIGRFAVGDKVWHSAPAALGTPGWICTTAGQPGHWALMPSLGA